MQTQTYGVKKRIPWAKILLVFMVIFMVVVVLGFTVPQIGTSLSGFGVMALDSVVGFVMWMAVTQTAIAVAATALVLILITQRRYFIRKRVTVAVPTYGVAPLQQQLQGSSTLFNPLNTDVKPEDNQA